jgi:hypothetical protein
METHQVIDCSWNNLQIVFREFATSVPRTETQCVDQLNAEGDMSAISGRQSVN